MNKCVLAYNFFTNNLSYIAFCDINTFTKAYELLNRDFDEFKDLNVENQSIICAHFLRDLYFSKMDPKQKRN